jgi:hypothetical protein
VILSFEESVTVTLSNIRNYFSHDVSFHRVSSHYKQCDSYEKYEDGLGPHIWVYSESSSSSVSSVSSSLVNAAATTTMVAPTATMAVVIRRPVAAPFARILV